MVMGYAAGKGPALMLRLFIFAVLALSLVVIGVPLFFAGFGQAPRQPPDLPPVMGDMMVRVYLENSNGPTALPSPLGSTAAAGTQVLELPLEDYVRGVVAAEMPALFEPEALKAQAVVARTYAVRRLRILGGAGCDQHPQADVCGDPQTGQAYATAEEMRDRWGALRFWRYWRRIEDAVAQTRSEILVHDGRPIDAVYHSTSGGHTEAAATVWGQDVAYLQGVPSPYEDHSPRLKQEVSFSLREFAARLDLPPGALQSRLESGRPVMEVAEQGVSGRARTLLIAGGTFDARDVRNRLGLNSTWFTWDWSDNTVSLSVRGFGHGVGMSQYGADGMAKEGAVYEQILEHYYPGTILRPLFLE